MARKTNETKARETCALHNVAVYHEPDGVELWGRRNHTCAEAGTHYDYFPREYYRSDAAMWADVATVAATFKPCAEDCECRYVVCSFCSASVLPTEAHECVSRETECAICAIGGECGRHKPNHSEWETPATTICGACGNSGNVADFMETHECVNSPTIYNVEYSDECGHSSTVAHVGLKSVVDTIARMGDTDDAIGLNGENLTCNNVPEQWSDSGEGYEFVTICGRYPHPSGDPERITLFTIVVTRPTPVSDTFPACDTCGQWEELCACMEISTCPICGDPIDYCLGHGPIDPNHLEGM